MIKIGGGRTVGNVKGRIELDKYFLDMRHYGQSYSEWVKSEKFFINPVIGLHKLLFGFNVNESVRFIKKISDYVGDTSRTAFYLLNRDVTREVNPSLLYLFEEIATAIATWKFEDGYFVLRFTKGPRSGEARLPAQDL